MRTVNEMSQIHSRETYIVPEYAIPYIANGDADILTDQEVDEIQQFLNKITPPGTYFVMGAIPEESYFAWQNDIKRIGTGCKDIEFVFMYLKPNDRD